MSARKPRNSAETVGRIDRISLDLLAQLELQTRVVLNLLERAPASQRAEYLERLAELRGRLTRLRNEFRLGSKPAVVGATKRDEGGERT
jgi:hypothetical protein